MGVLIMSLAALGVAYGLWAETLHIEGTVNTGTLDLEWLVDESSCDDTGIDPGYGKDVGSVSLAPGPTADVLLLTVHNAYPSYSLACSLTYVNSGSIPVKVRQIITSYPSDKLTVSYSNGSIVQIEPGQEKTCTVDIHLKQQAEAGVSYT
ncbi:unnamed protein product, partial [marine sediment metagenome]